MYYENIINIKQQKITTTTCKKETTKTTSICTMKTS